MKKKKKTDYRCTNSASKNIHVVTNRYVHLLFRLTANRSLSIQLKFNHFEFFYHTGNHEQQRRNEHSFERNVNATNSTAQTKPIIQSSPQLQSIQQSGQQRHAKPQQTRFEQPTPSEGQEYRSIGGARRKKPFERCVRLEPHIFHIFN